MKRIVAIFFLLSISNLYSQHTFSIVAVDTLTGEIGSAGATCGDSIIWPGTPGAYIISDILPGVGAIHTQSFWLASNQVNARVQMQQGVLQIRLFPGWLPMMPKIILSRDNMVWWIIVMDHLDRLLLQEQVALIIKIIFWDLTMPFKETYC